MASIRKNVITATISNVFNNASYFIFVLILAKKYSVHELSYYSLSFNIYFLTTLFASMGIGNLIIREYHKSSNRVKFVSTLIQLELLSASVAYGATLAIALLANYEVRVVHFLFIVCLMAFFDNINFVFSNAFVSLREQQYTSMASMTEGCTKLLFGAYIYLSGGLSLLVVAAVLVLLRCITLLVQGTFFVRYHRLHDPSAHFSLFQFDRSLARMIFRDGKTFFFITLIVAAYNRLPIILLSKLSVMEQVTYMDMGFKAFNTMSFVPAILVNTFYPTILKHLNEFQQLSEKTSKFIQAYISFSNIALVVSYLLVPFAFAIVFGHKFDPSIGVFQLLVLSLTLTGIMSTQANILFAHGLERVDLIMNIGMFIVVIGLVFCLVPTFNSLGAALSLFIPDLGFVLVQNKILRKRFPALHIHYSMIDAIVVPLILAIFIFLNNMPYSRIALYVLSTGYLVATFTRYKSVLYEMIQRFFFKTETKRA